MKVVILAGGLGSRLAEETSLRPKPMVEIGGKPILWHIMKIYSSYGLTDFTICAGYKGYVIKEYFKNYFFHNSDITYDLTNNSALIHRTDAEPWKVTIVDTGSDTMTGGRLKRVAEHLGDEDFCFTYGDGLGNIDIDALIKFHKSHGCLATLTAAHPPGRFGALMLNGTSVECFNEKPQGDGAWVNAGFFVLSKQVIDLIPDDTCIWEEEPLETLAENGQLQAFFHGGFWQPMDTLRDKQKLEEYWNNGKQSWLK
ncbi:glucose-1-phosphate cytidylyltransferase [Amylibacter sp.]|nr:glucose-1-phosphate cytidylyltransferase [Amylibacter sp.]MDB4095642.1 glucose-1-phosphate cytidylyltransferase [Amylibacter sp.]